MAKKTSDKPKRKRRAKLQMTIMAGASRYNSGGGGQPGDQLQLGTLQDYYKSVPRNLNKQFMLALKHASEEDLIQVLVDDLTAIIASGFHHEISSNKSAKTHFDKFARDNDMDDRIRETVETLDIVDHVVVMWKTDDRGKLLFINILSPGTYDLKVGHGTMQLWIEPSKAIKAAMDNKGRPESAVFLKNIPKKWLKAARDGKKVPLDEKDGEFFDYAVTRGRRLEGLPGPTMRTIFSDIDIRRMLKDGDAALTYEIKRMICLIQGGETNTDSRMGGPTETWLSKKDREEMQSILRDPSRAIRIVGDHTWTIKYVLPDLDAFDGKKYQPVELRYLRWAGITVTLLDGEGKGFATAQIGLKPLLAKVAMRRKIVTRLWQRIYSHKTIRGNIRDGDIPGFHWNQNVLEEAKALLSKVQFMVESGVGSGQTALEDLGGSVETEKVRKREQHKNPKDWTPVYNRNSGKTPGRPDEVGTPGDVDHNTPRATTAGATLAKAEVDYMLANGFMGIESVLLADKQEGDWWKLDVNPSLGTIVGSKTLDDGTRLMFGLKKDGKTTGVKIAWLPKGLADTMKEAKDQVKQYKGVK